jgi:hypothetical protein
VQRQQGPQAGRRRPGARPLVTTARVTKE